MANDLVAAGAKAAAHGAMTWLRQQGLSWNSAALSARIGEEVAAALPAAVEDVRAALDCGMRDVAEQTFVASMVMAGIAAARKATGLTPCNCGNAACAAQTGHCGAYKA